MTGHASKKQAVFTKFWLAILKRRPRHRWVNIQVAHKELVDVNCIQLS